MYPLGTLLLALAQIAAAIALFIAWDIFRYPVCHYCGDNLATSRSLASKEVYCRKHGTLVPVKEAYSFIDGDHYVTRQHTIFIRAA